VELAILKDMENPTARGRERVLREEKGRGKSPTTEEEEKEKGQKQKADYLNGQHFLLLIHRGQWGRT